MVKKKKMILTLIGNGLVHKNILKKLHLFIFYGLYNKRDIIAGEV